MPTVSYQAHFPWNRRVSGAPATNRPYAEVILGASPGVRIWCLVDSGADRIQVDRAFARQAGLSLANATRKTMATAGGGTTTVDALAGVNLTIEGKAIVDDCYFGANATPLLGRITFLNAFDVGFDGSGWYRGP
jgi:hypothetical protein